MHEYCFQFGQLFVELIKGQVFYLSNNQNKIVSI